MPRQLTGLSASAPWHAACAQNRAMASAAMRVSDASMVRVVQGQTREAKSKERGGGKGAGRWRSGKEGEGKRSPCKLMQTGAPPSVRCRRTGGGLTGGVFLGKCVEV